MFIRGCDEQFVVGLGHVGQGFQRASGFLSVVVVPQISQHEGGLLRIHLIQGRLQRRHAQVLCFVIGHRGGYPGLDAYFEREAPDELGEEAVQGAHRHAVGFQEGGAQGFLEPSLVMHFHVDLDALAELETFLLIGGGLFQFLDELHDEFGRGGPGEGQRGDVLVLDAFLGEELDDAIRQAEGLARAGRRENGQVGNGRHGEITWWWAWFRPYLGGRSACTRGACVP